jgi:hypothetical protein
MKVLAQSINTHGTIAKISAASSQILSVQVSRSQPAAGGWQPKASVSASSISTPPKVFIAPEVKQAVAEFEKLGGKGKWISAANPFSQQKQGFFVVTQNPPRIDPKAGLFMLRESSNKQYLDEVIHSGVPIVIGSPPEGIEGAALGKEFPMVAQALSTSGSKHSSVILIPPHANKFTLAHEFQHWRDFENPKLEAEFKSDLRPFLQAKYLNVEDKQFITRIMWEMRGHGAQFNCAMASAKKELPILDVGGRIMPKSKAKEQYEFEASRTTKDFQQEYQLPVTSLLSKIAKNDPAGLKQFLSKMALYETPGPKNPVNISKFASSFLR